MFLKVVNGVGGCVWLDCTRVGVSETGEKGVRFAGVKSGCKFKV
jgi:hypothetical protein